MILNLTPWILLSPLLGFLIIGLFGRALPKALIAWIACSAVAISLLLAAADLWSIVSVAPAQRTAVWTGWNWVTSGSFRLDFALINDPLTAVMLLIVTGVGFLIHVYSHGYMEDDPGYWRFFSYLNFFIFAMCLLVAADNYLMLLVGWAGVGLASYLLIGFWYTRPSAVAAARKAFVVNIIGDFGLIIAIYLLFERFGTLTYSGILTASRVTHTFGVNAGTLIAITLLLFLAAAAKSAQLPLYVWLPDAMEGPTPVSALIHAATMVTAGVYLVARSQTLFTQAPDALWVVAWIGGITAIFAASIALVQNDIKRIIAYSTISQLGYMFMAEGAYDYTAGIFHLMTHAFFKALLFLAAGAVIHAVGGEQDIRKMGGLRRKLPYTFWTFIAGGLALSAIFPFAGFWSKDEILAALLKAGNQYGAAYYALWAIGVITAGLTAFYIFRLIFITFLGDYRGPAPAGAHGHAAQEQHAPMSAHGSTADPTSSIHEAPWVMIIPMVILAVLSTIGGFIFNPFSSLLAPLLAQTRVVSLPLWLQYLSLGLGLLFALCGIGVAWLMYGRQQWRAVEHRNPLYTLLLNKYYVDELYDVAIVQPIVKFGKVANTVIENLALDGGSWGIGWISARSSGALRLLQSGYVRNYALAFLVGAVLIVLYYVARP
jgi:NADH-quinone oxidoreductase subunit L